MNLNVVRIERAIQMASWKVELVRWIRPFTMAQEMTLC